MSVIFLFNCLYVWLLDYSISLEARHDELIHELITLDNHELIQRLMEIMRSQLKTKEEIFLSHRDLNHGSLEPKASELPIELCFYPNLQYFTKYLPPA